MSMHRPCGISSLSVVGAMLAVAMRVALAAAQQQEEHENHGTTSTQSHSSTTTTTFLGNDNNDKLHEYWGLALFAVVLTLAYHAAQAASREPCATWIVTLQRRVAPKSSRPRPYQQQQHDDDDEPTEHSENDGEEQELVTVVPVPERPCSPTHELPCIYELSCTS